MSYQSICVAMTPNCTKLKFEHQKVGKFRRFPSRPFFCTPHSCSRIDSLRHFAEFSFHSWPAVKKTHGAEDQAEKTYSTKLGCCKNASKFVKKKNRLLDCESFRLKNNFKMQSFTKY
jgi:hypothetical protein